MGIFKSKNRKDTSVNGENRKEVLYKRKKGNRIVKRANKYPILGSMKLSKIRPTAVIDYISNNQNGLLSPVEGIFEKGKNIEKGYLVIALAESDLKKVIDNSSDRESIGMLINAIHKDMIKSATLPKSLDEGFLVLVPSDESIEILGDHEEIVKYEEGFHWGIFPDNISDSQVDSKNVYILNNKVDYEELLSLSRKLDESSNIELKNIQYDSRGIIVAADIEINGELLGESTVSPNTEDIAPSSKVSVEAFDNVYDTEDEIEKPSSIELNEEPREETVEMSADTFESAINNQNGEDNNTIVAGPAVPNVLGANDGVNDSDMELSTSEKSSDVEARESDEQEEISTENATAMVDLVKEKIRTFDRTPKDLGVTLSLEDISYLFMSGEVPILTLTEDTTDNELEKVLNTKRELANDQLKQVHLDNIQKIVDTYMDKSNEAIIKIREATSLDDSTNKLGKKKKELDNRYSSDKKKIEEQLDLYSKSVWDEYNAQKKQVIDSVVVQAQISFDKENKLTAEQKIKRRERELHANIDSSFENDVARLKAERLDEVKRLFEMINSDTIARLRGMYHKFQKTEKDMAEQYQQEIEKFSEEYWENELDRQRTVQRKLENDSTINDLQTKLAELESAKTKLVADNEKTMEELVVSNKKHLKNITEQFDREDSKRRNEFLEKERQYTEEISKQNKQIIKLREEYAEFQKLSQIEKTEIENKYQEEKSKYMREADNRVREELDRMNNESRERERLYTEKFHQKDIETRRAVKSTKLTATIGMIAAVLFGISIPIIGDKFLNEYNLLPKESSVSKVSSVTGSSETSGAKESMSELQNNSSSANVTTEVSNASSQNNTGVSQENSSVIGTDSESK